LGLIAAYRRVGMNDKAVSQVKEIYKLNPYFRLDQIDDPSIDPEDPKTVDYWNALSEVGLK
jgi:hypothetical protein